MSQGGDAIPTVGQAGGMTLPNFNTISGEQLQQLANKKSKLSKRYALGRLAPGWRETIFESLHSERLKMAVAVISATGCRPSELELGVVVQVKHAGELWIGIRGSKVDIASQRGQPLRILYVDTSTPWGEYLQERVVSCCEPLLVKYDAEGVSQRLREKSRELWPRRSSLVSAYSYRHFIGRSLKESGVPPVELAKSLVHASDFAQTCYGRAGGGKKTAGSHGILKAITKNPIRHSPKTDRHLRFVKSNNLVKGDQA